VETTEGWQPRSSGGERILVALAAIALLGAALIVAGNLLHRGDAISAASGSPRPTSPATPSPSPSPVELTVVPESSASAPPAPTLFGGWIRAKADLQILASPDESATVVGTLPAGALAYADEQAEGSPELGWATIEAPDPTGWVATRAGGKDLVQRYLPADNPVAGSIWTVAAGPAGFVAIGNAAGRSSSSARPAIFASADGANWHLASEPPPSGFNPAGVAWGPKGWLLVGSDAVSDGTLVWSSQDGDRWSLLGALPSVYSQGMAGSSVGYLLQSGGGRGPEVQPLWFSADGIRWSQSNPGLIGYYRVTATTAGFYAAPPAACCLGQSDAKAAFSTDGLTWSPSLPNLLVGALDGVLLGIEIGPDGLGGHPLRGSFYRGQVGWRPVINGDAPFSGAVVTSIVSDGQRATAFGWDLTTEASLTWTSNGGPWTRHELPRAFDVHPMMAAAGQRGVVAVGGQWTPRGVNAVLWSQHADGAWEPEPSPVLGTLPDPSAGACDPPTDAVAFVNLDRAMAVACYGDAPLTVRIWSASCDGCYGDAQGTYDEAWLSFPSRNSLFLEPVKWPGQWSSNAVLAPAIGPAPDPSWLDAWLELKGHFDDPASTGCHWTPPPDQLQYYSGARQIIEGCRQQFVVTAVRVVHGP
jgi:hypothetical protein